VRFYVMYLHNYCYAYTFFMYYTVMYYTFYKTIFKKRRLCFTQNLRIIPALAEEKSPKYAI